MRVEHSDQKLFCVPDASLKAVSVSCHLFPGGDSGQSIVVVVHDHEMGDDDVAEMYTSFLWVHFLFNPKFQSHRLELLA